MNNDFYSVDKVGLQPVKASEVCRSPAKAERLTLRGEF